MVKVNNIRVAAKEFVRIAFRYRHIEIAATCQHRIANVALVCLN